MSGLYASLVLIGVALGVMALLGLATMFAISTLYRFEFGRDR